MNLGEFEIQK